MNENVQSQQIKRTLLCKCGKKADFIKDYFLTETKTIKENDGDLATKRVHEQACGVLRRRYCSSCLSKIAKSRYWSNFGLNIKIVIATIIPFFVFFALYTVSLLAFKDTSAIAPMCIFGALAVVVPTAVGILLSVLQNNRKKIWKGDYSNVKAIDSLIDSMNFDLDDPKKVKDLSSLDVLIDGEGRANYDMERSGFKMRIEYNGKISVESMRQRLLYPFKEDAEHIRRTYINAEFIDENIKAITERELTDKDFDIKNGELRRYSGLSVEIVIPSGVTKICAQAFKKSKNCEKVVIPDSVTEIEKEAFAYCPATEINLPFGIKKIPSFAFYGSAVTKINVPDGVEEIEDNAFGECYRLEYAYIPSSCKRIGEAAFKNCTVLKEVTIEEGIEALADYCFNGCAVLERIEIPDGCYELGNFAFEGCRNLKEVYLPETIQFVGGRVFEGASQMSIYGKQGSYAEKFAEEYRLRFTVTDAPKYKKQHRARKI